MVLSIRTYNVWIKSKTLLQAKSKALSVWKRYRFYPRIYHFLEDGSFRFCVSKNVAHVMSLVGVV